MKNRIFLIGSMGAGKSSVGKSLAELLHWDFYDTDEEIEKSTGVDIGWIFDVEGEEGFRKRETTVLEELTVLPNIVLATGGGIILSEENQLLLKKHGTIVHLKVSVSLQGFRTINESRRPLLRFGNREEVLKKLYQEREPIYQNLADFSIVTDELSINQIAVKIFDWYRGHSTE